MKLASLAPGHRASVPIPAEVKQRLFKEEQALVDLAESLSPWFNAQERRLFSAAKSRFDAEGNLAPDDQDLLAGLVERYGDG